MTSFRFDRSTETTRQRDKRVVLESGTEGTTIVVLQLHLKVQIKKQLDNFYKVFGGARTQKLKPGWVSVRDSVSHERCTYLQGLSYTFFTWRCFQGMEHCSVTLASKLHVGLRRFPEALGPRELAGLAELESSGN